jgi:hypothetical protein
MAVQDDIPSLPDDNACMSGNGGNHDNSDNHGNSGNTSPDYLDPQPEQRDCVVPHIDQGQSDRPQGVQTDAGATPITALPALPVLPLCNTKLWNEFLRSCSCHLVAADALLSGSTWQPVPQQIVWCGIFCAVALL